jgi:hypothetical protein
MTNYDLRVQLCVSISHFFADFRCDSDSLPHRIPAWKDKSARSLLRKRHAEKARVFLYFRHFPIQFEKIGGAHGVTRPTTEERHMIRACLPEFPRFSRHIFHHDENVHLAGKAVLKTQMELQLSCTALQMLHSKRFATHP